MTSITILKRSSRASRFPEHAPPARENAHITRASFFLTALLTAVMAGCNGWAPVAVTPPAPLVPVVDEGRARAETWAKVRQQLDRLDAETVDAIPGAVATLQQFFAKCRAGARPFASDVLSFRATWVYLCSKLPWAAPQAHRDDLRRRFERHVLASGQLEQAIAASVQAYLDVQRDAEDRLLLVLRADLDDLPQSVLPDLRSDERLRHEFDRMVHEVAGTAAGHTAYDVGRLAGSLVAVDLADAVAVRVLATVTTRLGVSCSLLGVGTTSAVVTCGVGFVLAVLADMAIDWVVGWYYDPAGAIAARVEHALDTSCRLLVEGDAQVPGLQSALRDLADQRARQRRAALEQLILGTATAAPATAHGQDQDPPDPRTGEPHP
jgi:hypothetical protein